MDKIKIVSLNVRGLRDNAKRRQMFNFLKDTEAKIVCIQETHSCAEDANTWKQQWRGDSYLAHGTNFSGGTAILMKRDAKIDSKLIYSDDKGRIIMLEIKAENCSFLLVNVYAPAQHDDPDFFTQLFQRIQKNDLTDIIITGDLNVAINPNLDRANGRLYHPKAQTELIKWMEHLEISDWWRIENENKKQYSWFRSRDRASGSRIDYALLSDSLLNIVENVKYTSGYKTDHSMVELMISTGETKRGKGYWKFNQCILHENDYVMGINQILEKGDKPSTHLNPVANWENVKCKVIQYSKRYQIKRSKEKQQTLNEIKARICKAEAQLESDPHNIHAQLNLQLAMGKQNEFYEEKARAAAFRSKCNWDLYGEKSSKYFFNLEKSRANKKTIKKLIVEHKQEPIVEPKEILKEQHKFYADLYASNKKVKFTLKNTSNTRLTENDKNKLDEMITFDEIAAAVKALPKEKSPGGDGLPAEFYQFFYSKIKNLLMEAYSYARKEGFLNISARRGLICLIPKREKNILLLKNWRPLTMLATDFKILAKILATRMKTVLPSIISESQSGFMESRQISTTIRTTMDILNSKKLKGYVLSVDFEKCFDKIETCAILGSLRYFNFGEEFVAWVALLLNGFQSCIVHNGFFTKYFNVTRSTHQGDPLAPYLFLICGEVMALEVKNNANIKGITLNELETLILQFADDTQFFLNTEQSLNEVIRTLTLMEAQIGLVVNYEKSSVYALNDTPRCTVNRTIPWDPGGPNLLGINLSKTSEELYIEIIKKVQAVAKTWDHRNLTLIGRTLLINSLMGSLFVYKMQVLPDPSDRIIKDFENIIVKCIWNGKKPKVKTTTLYANKQKGGLRLVNLKHKFKALKIAWLFREDVFIQNQLSMLPPTELGHNFWHCQLNVNDVKQFLNIDSDPFWKQVAMHWFELTFKENIAESNEILQQVIWCNTHIRIRNKPVPPQNITDKGMVFISDIWDGHTFIDFERLKIKFEAKFTWLQYEQIKAAIPAKWIATIRKTNAPHTFVEQCYDRLAKAQKKVAVIYDMLNDRNNPLPELFRTISKYYCVTQEQYEKSFQHLYKVTNITKLRNFQYRLLVNAIPANDKLFHWKKVDSQKCEYCNDNKQTTKHLLFNCTFINEKIWRRFQKLVNNVMEIKATELNIPTPENMLLNNYHSSPGHIVNFMLLLAKQYIYACKCCKTKPSFKILMDKINLAQVTEKFNATRKNKLYKHLRKWAPYTKELIVANPKNQNKSDYIEEYVNNM